jgi:Trypsin-co-occurring domain 2
VIELASVVRDLRGELQAAIEAGTDEPLRFELGPIELEVTVAVERVGGLNGKVSFKVLEFGADRSKDTTDTQRIKLTLTPRLAGRRNAYISGTVEPDEEQ